MKLNASKTNTMIVSMSRTVHPELTPLTPDGTVLGESACGIRGASPLDGG